MSEPSDAPTMVPYFPYRDAAAALRFLSAAFDFGVAVEIPGDGEAVAHAEMRYGGGVIIGVRRYRARDPEGYEWSLGSYQPGSGAA